jgi:hypothetical protein
MTLISIALILLLITIIIGSLGLILFILGLILKKPGQWIPGIIFTVVSVILGIYSLIQFGDSIRHTSFRSNYNFTYNYNDTENDDTNNETPTAPEDKTNATKDENNSRISGFIQDDDKSLIYIKLYPEAELYDLGLKITKIDTYNGSGKDKKVIPLEINFANKFKGNLQLILFSSDNEELGSSNVQINQDGNTTFTIKFVFNKTANFLKTDHARLKTSD